MSVVKRIIQDSIERVKVDELLSEEYEQAGYGGITLTKTPLGAQINLYAMRPGRVIGKRGSAIRNASERLEYELGLSNPQITVVEVEVPELNPNIMAARLANALERGIHYRRALFWSLRRTMESGAIGCEIILKGKLRSDRARYEKVTEGYIPKAGDPALRYVKSAVIHVKQKKGTFGVTVTIVPPDAKFPDKVDLSNLPIIEYPEEEIVLPEGIEPDIIEGDIIEDETIQESIDKIEQSTETDAPEIQNDTTEIEKQPNEVESDEISTDTIQKDVEGQIETKTDTTTETNLENDSSSEKVETPLESEESLNKSEDSEKKLEE
jgi:small subunit ribosomal protein S3